MNDIATLAVSILSMALLVAVVTPASLWLCRTRLMDALLPIPEDDEVER